MALDYPQIDPIAFSVGPFDIRWYALAYIAGFLAGWQYCLTLVTKKEGESIRFAHKYESTYPDREHLDSLLSWIIIGVILGGRLGYVFFYHPGYYLSNPVDIFKIWQGGMAFHGGVIGAGLMAIIFALKSRVRVWGVLDLLSAAAPIGIFFGRIANFINAELYGRTSDVPWAMIFPGAGPEPRHPSQLYEAAFEGLVLWALIYLAIKSGKSLNRPGLVTGLFLSGYGVMRFGVEFFRAPDAHLGYLAGGMTMGQILTLPMIAIGLALVKYALRPGNDLAAKLERQNSSSKVKSGKEL